MILSPGSARADRKRRAFRHDADAGGRDEDLIRFAAIDHFGIAGDESDPGLIAGGGIEATMRLDQPAEDLLPE